MEQSWFIEWRILQAAMTATIVLSATLTLGEFAMKAILSTLVVLTVLAGIAAPASAFDAKGFYGQQERSAY